MIDADATHDLPVVRFPDGLVGFPRLKEFVLVRLEDQGLVFDLRSIEDEHVRFVVVPSVAFFADYFPVVDDLTTERLDLKDDANTLVLLVVNVGATIAESTANLMAPIVLNRTSRLAAQIVLDDSSLSLRAPLPA